VLPKESTEFNPKKEALLDENNEKLSFWAVFFDLFSNYPLKGNMETNSTRYENDNKQENANVFPISLLPSCIFCKINFE